jgi:hypothetical protein
MDEGRLIREQQQSAGLLVEASDAGDHWIALSPPDREEIVDRGTLADIV